MERHFAIKVQSYGDETRAGKHLNSANKSGELQEIRSLRSSNVGRSKNACDAQFWNGVGAAGSPRDPLARPRSCAGLGENHFGGNKFLTKFHRAQYLS
ncbi:unnamed protein product, partial [Brenthis ino]